MVRFKIPYEDRHVVSKTLLPLKFYKKEKVWKCSDSVAARWQAGNGLREYALDHMELPDKYKKHKINQVTRAWKHQKEAFNVVSNLDASYLYMLPGSGKTKVVIDYHNTNKPSLTLICCPKNVISTWSKQFDVHGIVDAKRNICMLEKGSSKKKDEKVSEIVKYAGILKGSYVIVVNYDTVWRLPSISKVNWDLIVFDEIHRLQSSSTQVTRFCSKLKGKKKVGLTGTPGEPVKWHGQFMCLDENLFGRNRKKFMEKYFVLDYFGNAKSPKDLDKLKEAFNLLAYVADNQDIIDIPQPTHNIVDIPQLSQREYARIEKEFMLEVESGVVTVQNAMVKSLKLRQICSGFVMDEERNIHKLNTAKQDYLKEFLKDNNENIVIFYNFKHEAEQIKESCGDRPFEIISGSEKRHTDNPLHGTVLAVQIRAGGTGIDGLQHNYRYVIYYSLSWSEIDHEQSVRRVWRSGQKETVHFYYFITKGTVEEKVYKSLKDKNNVIKEVLSG